MRILLVSLLLAASAGAQTSAADSSLVERTIASLRLDLTAEAMKSMGDGFAVSAKDSPAGAEAMAPLVGAFSSIRVSAVGDSIRAALHADFRPNLLVEALGYLESPVPQRMIDLAPFQVGQLSDPNEILELVEDPGDLPLADSALTIRYTETMMAATQPADVQREMAERLASGLLDALPADVRPEFEALGGAAAFADMATTFSAGSMDGPTRPMLIRTNRLVLGSIDEADIEAAAAYYESDAGRYVSRLASLATMRVLAPALVDGMAEMLRPMFEMMALDASLVHEAPDVEPVLVGGAQGLNARVVYPEAARRDGVEGTVFVEFVVDERGKPTDLMVSRSPSDLLSDAAITAVRASVFKPGTIGGRPVNVRMTLPVQFRLAPPADGG